MLLLTGDTVNGNGSTARSGAQALMLLATPLNFSILQALEDGPKPQVDLRRATGSLAATTLRAHLRELAAAGTVTKDRDSAFPGGLEFGLTAAGRDLIDVAGVMQSWLATAPGGALQLGANATKAAIKALCDGWSSTMVRALAAGPLSLTELDGVIGALNYPSLERRLGAMRLIGLVEARRDGGKRTPYGFTRWGRRAAAPLAAAIRWERLHRPEQTVPPSRMDLEVLFLLATPLVTLATDLAGSCRLAIAITTGRKHGLAGVMVSIVEGRIDSCATRLEGCPDAWVSGPALAWLSAMLEPGETDMELGGDIELGRAVVAALRESLSPADARERAA